MDIKMPARRTRANLSLLLAAMIWGSSFFILKDSLEYFPTFMVLALRFAGAAVLLGAIFFRRLRAAGRREVLFGVILGVLYAGGFAVQTLGLTGTTPGKNAFLTASYCVLVPFLSWALERKAPDKYDFIAVFVCLAGIGLITLSGSLTLGYGDFMTLLSGVFYASHIVFVERFGRGRDPVPMLVIQMSVCAVLLTALSFLSGEKFPLNAPAGAWGGVIYLMLFPSALASLLQNSSQQHTTSTAAALILSLESVFGVLFSVIFYKERVTLITGIGFAVVFAAIVISVTKLSFLRRAGAKTN